MKKLLFSAYSLDIGGIETALVTLLNTLIEKYDVTLCLEKKQGIFMDQLDKRIKIIKYTPCESKIKLISKIKNAIHRWNFIAKYKDKFDCSISYATYSLPGSFVARTASKNCILWVHSDHMLVFKNNVQEYKRFFQEIKADKFKRIVFVSNSSKNTFEKILGDKIKNERITINNLINYEAILEKSKEVVDDISKSKIPTFLFVGRHTEYDKKISRLIEACEKIKKDRLNFRLLVVGDGEDSERYKSMVAEKKLNDVIIFLGKKKNPYPYFKISDCLVLTSEHEGFPVVFMEAIVLNLPIITTKVSDSEEVINNKYGLIVEKNADSIYEGMKDFIKNGYKIREKFDAKQYNKEILEKIKYLIEG